MTAQRVGRNDPCPCGSGRKYKQCCALKKEKLSPASLVAIAAAVLAIVVAVLYNFSGDRTSGSRQVWDPEHGHYHTVP